MVKLFQQIQLVLLLLLVGGCATIVRPEGGPKDEIPPEVVKTKPTDGSLNFNQKKIKIFFNEFVQSDNLSKNMIVSPPLSTLPYTVDRGKSISIRLEDTLLPNITYNFTFQDVIKDLNEGNVMPVYRYVFSTGTKIDSSGFGGYVLDASTLEPSSEILIALYDTNFVLDSSTNIIPKYITRTNEEGRFDIRYINKQYYTLLAFEDGNGDYIYGKGDKVALYFDSIFPTDTNYHTRIDTTRNDSGRLIFKRTLIDFPSAQDSATAYDLEDSIAYSPQIFLYLFAPKVKLEQAIIEDKRLNNDQILIVFENPNDNIPNIQNIYFPEKKEWYYMEADTNYDSILLWITDTAVRNSDTLDLAFSFQKKDSVGEWYTFYDTISFDKKIEKKRGKERKRKKGEPIIDSVEIEIDEIINLQWSIQLQIKDGDTIRTDTILKDADTIFAIPVKLFFSDTLLKKNFTDETAKKRELIEEHIVYETKTISLQPPMEVEDSIGAELEDVFDTTIRKHEERDTIYGIVNWDDTISSHPILNAIIDPNSPIPFAIETSTTTGFTPFSTLTLTTSIPIRKWEKDSIKITQLKERDSTLIDIPFTMKMGDFGSHEVTIKAEWKVDETYTLTIDSGVFENIYHGVNLPLEKTIQGAVGDDLSSLFMNITYTDSTPLIVQLLSENEEVQREVFITNSQKITFAYLSPAKYIIKVIFDANNNGKWDNGSFLYEEDKLPEKVLYYNKMLPIKKNIDIEESWKISTSDNPNPTEKFLEEKKEDNSFLNF